MPWKGKPNAWIKVEDVHGWQTEELICPGKKTCCCRCRKRRNAVTWQISEQEKQERWKQNLELLKAQDQEAPQTYGATSGTSEHSAQ